MDRPNASFAWHFPDGRSPWPLRPAFQGGFASLIHAFMVLESMVGRLHTRWPRGRESVGMEEFVSPKRGSFAMHCLPDTPASTLRATYRRVTAGPATPAVLVVGLISGGTVNLSHVASHFHGPASVASNDRRRRRFFQFTSSTRTGWRVRWWRGSTYARPCGCALTAPIGSKDIRFASRSEAICIVVT